MTKLEAQMWKYWLVALGKVILLTWGGGEAADWIVKVFLLTVGPRYNEPRYNEDPVITNNIWKLGRITVKYVETNPAITNPRYNEPPL